MTAAARFKPVLALVIGLLLLAVFPLAAGRPTIYEDTRSYYALGQQFAEQAGLAPAGSSLRALRGDPNGPDADKDPRLAYTVAGSRSPVYSAFLYFVEQIGTSWAVVALQAGLIGGLIYVVGRKLGVGGAYLPTLFVLAFFSSLPVVANFLMPDVFIGAAALGAIYFLCAPRKDRLTSLAMAAVLVFAFAVHTTNLVIIALAVLVGAPVAVWLKGISARQAVSGAMVILACICAAVGIGVVYRAGVNAIKHERLYNPPFLTGRLIADGPGLVHLQHACARGPVYVMCRFKDARPTSVEDVLWSDDPVKGSFQLADYDTRVALIREQPRFVIGTLLDQPVGVVGAASKNVLTLMRRLSLDEDYLDPTAHYLTPEHAVLWKITPDGEACLAKPVRCKPRVPLPLIDGLVLAGFLGGLAAIVLLFGKVSRRQPQVAWAAALAVLIVLINAGVCGALSGPATRYQTRVSWFLPMAGVWMIYAARGRREMAAPVAAPLPA